MTHPSLIRPTPPTPQSFLRNLRDLPQAISISGFTAGFIMVMVTYTGPLLLIFEAAAAAQLSAEETASWVWAGIVGNGLATIFLSLLYRMPITMPFSTAGAALLVSSLGQYTLNEAVGAYIIAGLAITVLGFSGLFARLMSWIPQPVILAVLAGVLLNFGLNIFNALDDSPNNPLVILLMVSVFFLLKRVRFRAPSLGALIVGVLITGALGMIEFSPITVAPSLPNITLPVFTLNAALSLSLPLVALVVSSQYAPGQAVLLANEYDAPINQILSVSGILSMLLAMFGSHGNCLGALSAAIVVGPDSQPDPDKRYASAVASGLWHLTLGIFGTTIVALFAIFPGVFVSTIAGLALSGIIASSLGGAMDKPDNRDAAIVAFLCTAGNFSLLGIGAPFWGLLAGVAIHALMKGQIWRRKAPAQPKQS